MQELIPRTTVAAIVGHRNAAMVKMAEAVRTLERGYALAEEARELATLAHGGARFGGVDRDASDAYRRLFQGIDEERSMAVWRAHLDACVWTNLMHITGMRELMDRTAKAELQAQLETDVPEVCESTIYATLDTLRGEAHLIFQRGLARAFIELDKRFKSHDAFKLGSRIILEHLFDEWGHMRWGRTRDTIADVERVFAVLDGQRHPDTFRSVEAVRQDRGSGWSPRQSCTETEYFRIRCFKNGNAHLWFTRDDLVDKANQVLADYYGEVLPDAVTRTPKTTGALSRDLAFYATPPEAAAHAIAQVGIKGRAVLEPSAGEGGLVRAILADGAASVTAVEVHAGRVRTLEAIRDPRLTVLPANFLAMTPDARYDAVVMNPPFCGTHWMEHVQHALRFLRPGGDLVAILPATAEVGQSAKHRAFREWAKPYSRWDTWRSLPPESFAASGTRINTVTLHLMVPC